VALERVSGLVELGKIAPRDIGKPRAPLVDRGSMARVPAKKLLMTQAGH